MAQTSVPGGPILPCSPKQALALYQLLFQRPASLGQLQTALQQVHEGWDCPPGLALPMLLLEMEQSLRAQEKLLWDLELLTGVGLGLFWPPWAGSYGQRDQTQHAWNQCSQSWGRNLDGDSEQPNSKLHPPTQAGETPSDSHQLLKGKQATDPSSASDLAKGGNNADPRLEGLIMPAEMAPGTPIRVCQETNGAGTAGAGCLHPTSSGSFKEPGNPELKDPDKMEERNQAGTNVQSSCGQAHRSLQEGTLDQEGTEPSDLASQGLPERQDPSKGLGAGLSHERAERAEGTEPSTLLTDSPPRGHSEETPQGQRGLSPRDYTGESIWGQDKGAPQSKKERKQAQQGQELKAPQFGEGGNSEVWGEATVWYQEEGDPEGHLRDFCRPPGKPIPVETGIPGPPGSSTQLTQVMATQEGSWAPSPASMPLPATPTLRDPGGGIPTFGAQEPQPRLQGALWEHRGPREPKSSMAAWPELRCREEALAGAEQEALQRLLELHSAARERRRRDREQQRLRVLERLRILRNHHRRVHPLGIPPNAAQMAPQGDVAGWRRVLRERLEQVHRGRTQWLRALGARNTQNFQELLSPGTEKPSPGE